MYLNGEGVPKDYTKAFYWYSQAASEGFAIAQLSVGQFYLNGIVVAQDDNKAYEWLKKAADQGDTEAQGHIDELLSEGKITRELDE